MQRPDLFEYFALQLLFAILQQRTVNIAANQSDVHGCYFLSVFLFYHGFPLRKSPDTAFAPFPCTAQRLGW
jgi:hypothetical protein